MSDALPVIRCSQLPQLFRCPGSATLLRRIRDLMKAAGMETERNSQASLVGSWCHWKAAQTLVDRHGATPPPEGLKEPAMPRGWKPSWLDLWVVRFYVDTVLTYNTPDAALEVEGEFSHRFARFVLSGHMDENSVTADGTDIVGGDLKRGVIPVDPAAENEQGLGYIVLLALTYALAKRIAFFFCQPTNNEAQGFDRVSYVEVVGDEIRACVASLERRVNEALDNAMLLDSDDWKACRYCIMPMYGCPAFNADLDEMKTTITPELLAALKAQPEIAQLVRIELARKRLEPIFDANKDLLKDFIERNGEQEVDGLKVWITEKNGKRTVTDNEKACSALADLPDELFHGTYAFSLDAIERALAKHLRLPLDSKKSACGKSITKDRLSAITETSTVKVLTVA